MIVSDTGSSKEPTEDPTVAPRPVSIAPDNSAMVVMMIIKGNKSERKRIQSVGCIVSFLLFGCFFFFLTLNQIAISPSQLTSLLVLLNHYRLYKNFKKYTIKFNNNKNNNLNLIILLLVVRVTNNKIIEIKITTNHKVWVHQKKSTV